MPLRIAAILLILSATAILSLPAFLNGYPFVYSDTGAYIYSGFANSVPSDRPITYGLFLRHSSLASSTWFTVIAQGLIYALLLFFLIGKITATPQRRNLVYLISILLLTLFSSLPWYSSFLMADALSGAGFLLLWFLLFYPPSSIWLFSLLGLVWVFINSMHLTNWPAALFCLVGLTLMHAIPAWKKFVPPTASGRRSWILVLPAFLFLPLVHGLFSGDYSRSRSGHLFILARQVENGNLKRYLNENCKAESYAICAYRDSLPSAGSDFLWKDNSPLYRLGGWEGNKAEYQKINRVLLRDPEYLLPFLKYTFKIAWNQLFLHNTGEEFIPYDLTTPPGWEIAEKFKDDLPGFLGSRQARGDWGLFLNRMNTVQLLLLILSFGFCLFRLFFSKMEPVWKGSIVAFLFYYIGNILAVSIASSGSRYNSRLDWIWVLLALLILFRQKPEETGSAVG